MQKLRQIFDSIDYLDFKYDIDEDFETYTQKVLKHPDFKDFKCKKEVQLDSRFEGKYDLVMDDQNKPYMVILTKVDVQYGYYSANLYYRMQIGYDKFRNIYMLFTNWGRTGQFGQNQLTPFFTKEDVVKEFKAIFKQKTKNHYEDRNNFQKYNRKYQYLKPRIQYEIQDLMKINLFDEKRVKRSQLPQWQHEFISNILDEKYYQMVFRYYGIDEDVLPLGELNQDQVLQAKNILDRIQEELNLYEKKSQKMTNSESFMQGSIIFQLTNDYYELVPNSDNLAINLPVMNNQLLKIEYRKVNCLLNMSYISRVMISAKTHCYKMNPIDYCFRSLNIKIAALERDEEMYQIIDLYMKRGNQDNKNLEIQNIFAIERKGEAERFQKYKMKQNRRLLWHGTRTENVFSILKQGLRISPYDAKINGQLFDKGCYFSDQFSKAIQYSSRYYDQIKKSVYIFLFEVYLGKMKKVYKPFSVIAPLGKSYQSVKGSGCQAPIKSQSIFLNSGCMVPIGEIRQKNSNQQNGALFQRQQQIFGTSMKSVKIRNQIKLKNNQSENMNHKKEYYLRKNEFIVYREDQVRLRYVLELKQK